MQPEHAYCTCNNIQDKLKTLLFEELVNADNRPRVTEI